jgi:Big-like domain-containing protein/carbohydrate esterase-like protein
MSRVTRHIHAAVVILTLGSTWIPSQALAQILCIPGLTCPPADSTPPTVTITSPASGSTISGTINVTANASDNQGVAGVQFQLDGVNGGAEDGTAPYSVTWDTTATPNGTHTLTAVARDAAGNRTTSSPVTVTVSNNAPPPPPPPPAPEAGRFEESDPSVSLSAGWINRNADDWLVWSGGTAVQSTIPGSSATFSFTGTSVTWIGYRSVDSGQARVLVDGALVEQIDLFARRNESQSRVYSVRGLSAGNHTLRIEVTGQKNADSQGFLVVVDAFEVPARVVSHLQDTDPDLSYTAGWTGGDISKPWSGGSATFSSTSGARATLPFNGTAISWIGYRGPEAGIARVFVDGVSAGNVDLYATGPRIQGSVFSASGLADGMHTLTIEVTGQKNAAATGTLVLVDAFDVTRPGTRVQEEDPSIAYTGPWIHGNLNRSWSEGTISESDVAGARATFTFTGTSVSWIGCQKITTGIARVYIDGVFVREVDTFEPPPIEAYQYTVFSASGLAPGTHTLTIEATGRKNPSASNAFIVIDAFDVRP